MYGMKKHVIRLRISEVTAQWLRDYAKSNGTSVNQAIVNAIEAQQRRSQHRRMITPF